VTARRALAATCLLTVLGGVLRLATLDTQSYWLDELVTVSLLDQGFADMLRGVRETEATPYLYYVLAWPWAQAFGLGEIGLRSLSALVGTAAIPVAYGAGAAFCSRRVGVVAAALVAVHPFLVWYAQEARSYSLLVLLGACSALFLGRALQAPRRLDLIGWALASSLALATHYFAVFLVAAEAVWLLVRYERRRDAVVALLVPAVVLAAHVPLLDDQRGNGGTVADTSLPSRIAGIPKALVVGYSFPVELAGSVLAGALVALGLVLLATRAPRADLRGALVTGSLALATIVVPLVLALLGTDYLTARNVVVAVVPGAVAVAAGYASSRLGLVAGGALCALLLAITLGVSLDDRYGRTDWRGAAEWLGAPAGERAIVVTPYLSRSLWRPYLPGLEEPVGSSATVDEIAVVGLATEGGFSSGAVHPPAVAAPPPAPPGFELVGTDREPTFTLVRYRAARPTAVPVDVLAGMRLADRQPGVLLQGPAP
jgi:4-amino-4-deoxy-L-arabinose transferase-like glycosyltransferase